MINFDDRAVEIVRNYIIDHLDKSDPMPDFQVFAEFLSERERGWAGRHRSRCADRTA